MISDKHLEKLRVQAVKDYKRIRYLEETVKMLELNNKRLNDIISKIDESEVAKGVKEWLTTGSQEKPTPSKTT